METGSVLVRNDAADAKEPFAEMDPTGRYGRYAEILGVGGVKKVYRAFDVEDGMEVAWNQVNIRNLEGRPFAVDGLHTEVNVLRSVHHPNIIALHHVWQDHNAGIVNFITELCTSGDLRSYRFHHRRASCKAVRRWARQILAGIHHLHNRSSTHVIIHRDLNCSNVFINGFAGEVKIGDLGLAVVIERGKTAHAIVGTPEFMAPEMYTEEYTEKVDVYAFGMCVLELATAEVPYVECETTAGVVMKVVAGGRPETLAGVGDPEARALIERCLAAADQRPSAAELLDDPFLRVIEEPTEG